MRTFPHWQAIIGALRDADLIVGDHVAPKSVDGRVGAAYVVLYALPSPPRQGSIAQPFSDGLLRWQITSVAPTAAHAQDQADMAAEAIEAATLTVAGRAIFRARRESAGAVARDDDVSPPLYYQPDQYVLVSNDAAAGS